MSKPIFKYPAKRGKVEIQASNYNGQFISVDITGDSKGLKYLANLLIAFANYAETAADDPNGIKEHIHLHPNCQLSSHSCEVVIGKL